ncbi:hypothetical protein NL476_27330, partial [Klebsiella pneumoniae]|nr:hypothetical protein [Klebsiella pneumoniae]
ESAKVRARVGAMINRDIDEESGIQSESAKVRARVGAMINRDIDEESGRSGSLINSFIASANG